MEAIELLVDSATAQKIKDAGLVEMAFRRKDQKFNNFIKAKIVNGNASQETAKRIMEVALNSKVNEKNAANIHRAVNGLNLANKKLNDINTGLRTVTTNVESMLRLSKKVASLSYVQIALSAVNMTVDIAGFVIIANKLKGLSEQLNQIAKQIGELKDISIEDMRESCEILYLNYNSIVTKINDGDTLDRDNIETHLKQLKAFLSKLNRLLLKGTVDTEVLLNMIFMLLPAYTSILCIFLRLYYFEKLSTPLNYDHYFEVYQEINADDFQRVVQDYYLLEKNYSYREVIDILNILHSAIFNERLEIDDQLELISAFNTSEEYHTFEQQLEAAAQKEFAERVDEIASLCGEHENDCRRVLSAAN